MNKAGAILWMAVWGLCLMAACGEHSTEPAGDNCCELADEALAFRAARISRASILCSSDSNRCATISLVYPFMARGASAASEAKVNALLERAVLQTLADLAPGEDLQGSSLTDFVDRCIADYEELLADSPEYTVPWKVQTSGSIIGYDLGIVSIQLDNHTFTGGAHASNSRCLFSFVASTGQVLTLEDIVTNMPALRKLAEQKFRAVRGIPSSGNLRSIGSPDKAVFPLPDNFAWTQEGLQLHYSAFEASASLLHPTDFTLPRKALQPILRPPFSGVYEPK